MSIPPREKEPVQLFASEKADEMNETTVKLLKVPLSIRAATIREKVMTDTETPENIAKHTKMLEKKYIADSRKTTEQLYEEGKKKGDPLHCARETSLIRYEKIV